MAKVSAIVSAYYAAEYLEGRLDNIIDQDIIPDAEIVVVCQERSKENDIVDECFHNHTTPNVVKVKTRNIPTIYSAWNLGITHASGDYITNANSDDRLHPGALKALADALDENPDCGVAYFDITQVSEIGGEPIGKFEWAEGGLAALLRGCFLGPMPMWRKSLHDEYGMFNTDYHSAGDYEFWLRLASKGVEFHHIKEVLGTYLVRDDSAEHREPLRSTWETAKARGLYR